MARCPRLRRSFALPHPGWRVVPAQAELRPTTPGVARCPGSGGASPYHTRGGALSPAQTELRPTTPGMARCPRLRRSFALPHQGWRVVPGSDGASPYHTRDGALSRLRRTSPYHTRGGALSPAQTELRPTPPGMTRCPRLRRSFALPPPGWRVVPGSDGASPYPHPEVARCLQLRRNRSPTRDPPHSSPS